jgi:hypothetical protein
MFSKILDTEVKIEPIDIKPSYQMNFPAKRGNLQLWQFLLQLIESNSNKNENETKIIEWTRKSSAEFKLLDTKEVARLWGIHKKRPHMSYANVSRSLRYYYEKGIMEKVPGEPYGYRFINYKDLYLINPELVEPVNVSKCVKDLENQNSISVQQNSKPNNKRPKTVSVSTTKKLKSATSSSSCSNKNSAHRYAPYARPNENASMNKSSAYPNCIQNTNTSQYFKDFYSSSSDSSSTNATYESNHSLLPSEISSQPNISYNNNSSSSHYNVYQSTESTASSNTPQQYYTQSPTDNHHNHYFNQHYYQTSLEYQQQYQTSLYNHYYAQKQEYENYYSNLQTASYYKNLASPPASVSSTPTTSYLSSTNQYNQFYSPSSDVCVARQSNFDANSTKNNSEFSSNEYQTKQSNFNTYNYSNQYYYTKISTPMSLSPASSSSNSSTSSYDSFANSTSYRNSLDNMSTSIHY